MRPSTCKLRPSTCQNDGSRCKKVAWKGKMVQVLDLLHPFWHEVTPLQGTARKIKSPHEIQKSPHHWQITMAQHAQKFNQTLWYRSRISSCLCLYMSSHESLMAHWLPSERFSGTPTSMTSQSSSLIRAMASSSDTSRYGGRVKLPSGYLT